MTLQEIMAEHRQCGPGFDGCYSHWPTPHCRADGMTWPCDVDAIRAVIGPHTHAPGQTDKRCAECYREREAQGIPLAAVAGIVPGVGQAVENRIERERREAQGIPLIPDGCDRIVNNGMGEPTECGRTLPCEYHGGI